MYHENKIKPLILLVSGVLIILIVVGVFFLAKPSSSNIHTLSYTPKSALIAFGVTPVSTLYHLSFTASSTEPVYQSAPSIIPGVVMDMAEDASSTYYLMYDQKTLTSNIFSINTNNATSSVRLITNSPTLKADLSYDPISQTFAYQATTIHSPEDLIATTTSWHIVVFKKGQLEEPAVKGEHPTILTGGIYVVFENNGAISSYNRVASTTAPLLSIGNKIPFAVSTAQNEIALYNSARKQVDVYNIKNITSASFERSLPISFVPLDLHYSALKLYGVGVSSLENVMTPSPKYMFAQIPASTTPITFTISQEYLQPQKIVLVQ